MQGNTELGVTAEDSAIAECNSSPKHLAPHLANAGWDTDTIQALIDGQEKEKLFGQDPTTDPATKVNKRENSYIINVMMIKMSAFLIF